MRSFLGEHIARGGVSSISDMIGGDNGGSASGAAAADPVPPPVLRGANCQVGLDWVRGSCPASSRSEAQVILSEFLGIALVEGLGRFNLDSSMRGGASGVYFDSGGNAAYIVVDVAGSDLAGLPPDEQRRFLHRLSAIGLRATRVDISCDWRGGGICLVQSVERWCQAGSLVGARTFKVMRQQELFGLTGEGVMIGARGSDGSGRYVRVYDKGLEQKSAERGCWVRWELEASDAVARDVVSRLLAAEDWRVAGAAIALGAVDFLDGDRFVRASRRSRLPEWSAVIDGIKVERIVATRVASSFNTWARWITRAVLPGAAALGALVGGLTGSQVLERVERLAGSSDSWLSSNKAVAVTQALCHGVTGSDLGADFLRLLGASEAADQDGGSHVVCSSVVHGSPGHGVSGGVLAPAVKAATDNLFSNGAKEVQWFGRA